MGEQAEEIHILPGSYGIQAALALSGVKVIMKSGKAYPKVVEQLRENHFPAYMAENCTMENQKLYHGAEHFPEKAGYYTLMIVKDSLKEDGDR